MKIAVIGAGGVGGYFGGRLAKANYDVTFLARGEHLREIKQNGLRVKSVNGDFVVENAQATDCILPMEIKARKKITGLPSA